MYICIFYYFTCSPFCLASEIYYECTLRISYHTWTYYFSKRVTRIQRDISTKYPDLIYSTPFRCITDIKDTEAHASRGLHPKLNVNNIQYVAYILQEKLLMQFLTFICLSTGVVNAISVSWASVRLSFPAEKLPVQDRGISILLKSQGTYILDTMHNCSLLYH